MIRLKNAGAITLLLVMAWLSFAIGKTFSNALLVLSLMVWTICIGMVIYMVFFRNIKLSLFDWTLGGDEEEDEDGYEEGLHTEHGSVPSLTVVEGGVPQNGE